MPQTKKQKRENALKYWENELGKYITHWGEDNYHVRYAKEQIVILKQKLGLK